MNPGTQPLGTGVPLPSSLLQLRVLAEAAVAFLTVFSWASFPSQHGLAAVRIQTLKFELEIEQTAAVDIRQRLIVSGSQR